MARLYTVIQVTESALTVPCAGGEPINTQPSISDDGRRIVYTAKPDDNLEAPLRLLRLYDTDTPDEHPRILSTRVRGEERRIAGAPGLPARISGAGRKIVFASRSWYTEDPESGIYLYDVTSEAARRVVTDSIPRADTGAELGGEPGMSKLVCEKPSINTDGSWTSSVNALYEYNGETGDRWGRKRETLMITQVTERKIIRDPVLHVPYRNAFGCGIRSQSISGDGHVIAFYAGGEIEGLEVRNIEMPPYREVPHRGAGLTCDVFCYVAVIRRPGRYGLRVVPDPESPTKPLIVAHPYANNVQSYDMANVLTHSPSLTFHGDKIALHAGFVMGESKTGVYLYDLGGDTTTLIRSFGSRPGTTDPSVNLVTASHPVLSSDGNWLAYYLRDVRFPEHYNDPDSPMHKHKKTYCPSIDKDEVVVRDLRSGEETRLIESTRDPAPPQATLFMGLDIDRDGRHVVFISRTDKVGKNSDNSHEVFLATIRDILRRGAPRARP